MDRFRDGYAVLLGGFLLVTALFLPGISEALFPDKTLSGWVIAAIGAAAVFDIGQDTMTNILAALFISNSAFVICTILFPLLKGGPLIAASWLCIASLVFAVTMTLFFLPNTHFSAGHYLWLSGMGLVTWGYYRRVKRSQASA